MGRTKAKERPLYRQVVYVGTSERSTVVGKVTGKRYVFLKDTYHMPIPTRVDEKDYPGVLALRGKGCTRRNPEAIFISKDDWDLELESARRVNS